MPFGKLRARNARRRTQKKIKKFIAEGHRKILFVIANRYRVKQSRYKVPIWNLEFEMWN